MTKTKTCIRCEATERLEKFVDAGRGRYRNICKQCNILERINGRVLLEKPPELLLQPKGDGPCWCCRNQAAGETPYRLCIICAG